MFYFSIWIITVIHEVIGHFARKYLYYYIESNKEFHTDRDKQIEDDGIELYQTIIIRSRKIIHQVLMR